MGNRSTQSVLKCSTIENISSPISTTIRWNKGPKIAIHVQREAIQLSLSDGFSCTGASPALLAWLEEYLNGHPPFFQPLLTGSPFQQKVMQALLEVPFGQTISYRDLAIRCGSPSAARAIGNACGRNHLPLLIPCHRVIHSNGSLGGFALDLKIKERLLEFERAERDSRSRSVTIDL